MDAKLEALLRNDAQFASHMTTNKQLRQMLDTPSLPERIELACRLYSERNAFGFKDGEGAQHYYTYTEVWQLVQKLIKHFNFEHLQVVAIRGFPSAFICIIELVCFIQGCVIVPLPIHAGHAELLGMLKDAKVTRLVCDVDAFIDSNELDVPQDTFSFNNPITTIKFKQLQYEVDPESIKICTHSPPSNPSMILFTSGSTGPPKGAVYTNDIVLQIVSNFIDPSPNSTFIPKIVLLFLPLNHVIGLFILVDSFFQGGVLHFTNPDFSTFIHDLLDVQPTKLSLVPRIAEMICNYSKDNPFKLTRLLYASVGTAPMNPVLFNKLESLFNTPIFNMYGATEYGITLMNGKIEDKVITDHKLVPGPLKGELWIKSKLQIPRYLTKPVDVDSNGWFHTGDIFTVDADKTYTWIDKSSNIHKLQNGEFVAIWALESTFISDLVHQIYIYDNINYSFLMAVVVSPCNDHSQIRSDLYQTAVDQQLEPFQLPRHFIITNEPFTTNNNLLTTSSKLDHKRLKDKYEHQLLSALETSPHSHNKAIEVFESVLKVAVTPSDSYALLGGDSIGAVEIHNALLKLNINIPVSHILNPNKTIQELIDLQPSEYVKFKDIHKSNNYKSSELNLNLFITSNTADVKPYAKYINNIFMTGASGYLGRFILLHLLQLNCTITILLRNGEHQLLDIYSEDTRMINIYNSNKHNLTIVKGDFSVPKLGLTNTEYTRISNECDSIIHCGALVNHILHYSDLFIPNVLGTVEMIKFAKTGKLKYFHFISSIGALTDDYNSELDMTTLRPSINDTTMGYGISKWAGEILVNQLPQHTIYRCCDLLTSNYDSQINKNDYFTKLLVGMLYTGLAPEIDGNCVLHGLPVDYVAKSIAMMVLDNKQGTYNVVNSESTTTMNDVVHWIREMPVGNRIKKMDSKEWYLLFSNKLGELPMELRRKTPYQLLGHFSDFKEVELENGRYKRVLLENGIDIKNDESNRKLIQTTLENLKRIGHLDALGTKE